MKYILSVLMGCLGFLSLASAVYTPTAVDAQLIELFSAKITTMHQNNPTKIQAIAPKLQVIVGMYTDETREHYVLNGLYLHIMSLLSQVTRTTTTAVAPSVTVTPTPVAIPTPAPVVTTTTSAATSLSLAVENNLTNLGGSVSYVSPGVYNDKDVQALYNLIQSEYTKGNPNAEFTFIKFSDYQCPYCHQYWKADTEDKLLEHYGSKINYVLTHLVANQSHSLAAKAAEATECIGEQGGGSAYYAMVDALFSAEPNRTNIESSFDTISNGNLDKQAFLSCLDTGKYATKVIETRRIGVAFGEKYKRNTGESYGTPIHVFFNHKTGQFVVLNGNISLSSRTDTVIPNYEPTL